MRQQRAHSRNQKGNKEKPYHLYVAWPTQIKHAPASFKQLLSTRAPNIGLYLDKHLPWTYAIKIKSPGNNSRPQSSHRPKQSTDIYHKLKKFENKRLDFKEGFTLFNEYKLLNKTQPCPSHDALHPLIELNNSAHDVRTAVFNQLKHTRRQFMLSHLPLRLSFTQETRSPLCCHLAKAGAYENMACCLHPIYGFAYLPGSGLKGLTRAYAQTIASIDKKWLDVIFGTQQQAGLIVFHDAWPVTWPQLTCDVVNNHHQQYYANPSEETPPCDHENPNPSFFIAIKPNTAFEFILSVREGMANADIAADNLLRETAGWLQEALCALGHGAKTNTGYGLFNKAAQGMEIHGAEKQQPSRVSITPTPSSSHTNRLTSIYYITLQTPAFFAGAHNRTKPPSHDKDLHEEEACRLRPSSLKGYLRWWWRALHAGFLPLKELHHLEQAVFGSTDQSSPIQIDIKPVNHGSLKVELFDPKSSVITTDKGRIDPLNYIAYGIKDAGRFWVVPSEQTPHWRLTCTVRRSSYGKTNIDARDILEQLECALLLLSTFGGVGAKSRKGFGSITIQASSSPNESSLLKDASSLSLDQIIQTTVEKAESFYLKYQIRFKRQVIQSPFLSNSPSMKKETEIPLDKTFDHEEFMTRIGLAYHKTVQSLRGIEKPHRFIFGLPRKSLNPKRHGSLIHIHIERSLNKTTLRLMGFPDSHGLQRSPGPQQKGGKKNTYELESTPKNFESTSQAVSQAVKLLMKNIQTSLKTDLPKKLGSPPQNQAPHNRRRPTPVVSRNQQNPAPQTMPYKEGDIVTATLVGRTKRGKWEVRCRSWGDRTGFIDDSDCVPAHLKENDLVKVKIINIPSVSSQKIVVEYVESQP